MSIFCWYPSQLSLITVELFSKRFTMKFCRKYWFKECIENVSRKSHNDIRIKLFSEQNWKEYGFWKLYVMSCSIILYWKDGIKHIYQVKPYFVQNFMVNRLEKSSTVSNESWPGYQQNIDINNFYRPSIIFQNLKKVTFFYWSQWRYFKGMFKKVVLIEKISEHSSQVLFIVIDFFNMMLL
jgi:hypothetical protein